MKKNILTACMLCGTLSLTAQTASSGLNIIPTPLETKITEGAFQFNPLTTQVAAKGKEAKETTDFFKSKIKNATGLKLKSGKAFAENTITFVIDPSLQGDESYTLEVTPRQITAKSATGTGLFYAMQTLLQLMPAKVESSSPSVNIETWQIPSVQITDKPRFSHRGVMLDPCRHFLPVSAVKKQIDLLSSYKINRMHWHLTDDQGWRIEIKKYPKLTSIGSKRIEGDQSVHEGYYTQKEIKEVVEYARQRHVEIIPELEIPGHELAAIAAYPELSCKEEPTTPRIIWGVEDVVMCPGKELMFNFLQNVIDEMTPLFPSKYFHIGGDESPRVEWENCDKCQVRMKELGYKHEAQLQSYVIGRIEKYLHKKGKTIIGWDEILEGGNLDTTAIVMSWRGETGGITAAKAGHKVLMTPSNQGFYFDQFQGDPATEPYCAIGGYSPLKKVYSYDPVPKAIKDAGREDLVLGIQANCWSEYLPSVSHLEFRLYPRALALAEVGWSAVQRKDFTDFCRRVDGDASIRLQLRNVYFHIPQPEQPNGSFNYLAFTDTDTLQLKTTRPLRIVYTTDGTQPTVNSTTYSAPIVVNRSTTINAATVLPSGILSPTRTLYLDKQSYSKNIVKTDAKPGLLLKKWDGNYQQPTHIKGTPAINDSVVANIESLRSLASVPSNVRNVKDYAAMVEGYINIPETGIYEFSTNNNQLYIDGKLAVDNSHKAVPRHSAENRQLALTKGLHPIKVIFLGGIYGGWPSYWDSAKVTMRREGGKWQTISKEMLWH